MAIPAGLEPATRGVEIRYSIQLSYGTVLLGLLSAGHFASSYLGLVLEGKPPGSGLGKRDGHPHSTAFMKNPLFAERRSNHFPQSVD